MGPLAQFEQLASRPREAGGEGDWVPVANMWQYLALVRLRKSASWVLVVTAGGKAAP